VADAGVGSDEEEDARRETVVEGVPGVATAWEP